MRRARRVTETDGDGLRASPGELRATERRTMTRNHQQCGSALIYTDAERLLIFIYFIHCETAQVIYERLG